MLPMTKWTEWFFYLHSSSCPIKKVVWESGDHIPSSFLALMMWFVPFQEDVRMFEKYRFNGIQHKVNYQERKKPNMTEINKNCWFFIGLRVAHFYRIFSTVEEESDLDPQDFSIKYFYLFTKLSILIHLHLVY